MSVANEAKANRKLVNCGGQTLPRKNVKKIHQNHANFIAPHVTTRRGCARFLLPSKRRRDLPQGQLPHQPNTCIPDFDLERQLEFDNLSWCKEERKVYSSCKTSASLISNPSCQILTYSNRCKYKRYSFPSPLCKDLQAPTIFYLPHTRYGISSSAALPLYVAPCQHTTPHPFPTSCS